MNTETATRTTPDGTDLFTRVTAPDATPRATVVLVHGIAEHGGRYDHVAEQFATAGIAVRRTDLRGFGRSSGTRAFVDRFDDYVADLAADLTEARDAGLPVVLYGHSMGGLVALRYALSDHPTPDLVVLTAPAIGADVPAVKRGVAHVLSRIAPRFSLPNDLDGSHLADPLAHPRTTTRLGSEFMKAMKETTGWVRSGEVTPSMPTLVLHGAADPLVPPPVTAPLGELDGVERILMPGLRHEVHNEGPEAVDIAIRWIEERL